MKIGKKNFDRKNHTYIMGILNVTPDSFSDGGKWNQLDQALYHTEQMLKDGTDILDIGGESTRPGHQQISDQAEIERVVPIIEAVKQRFDVPISIDTYKSQVAEAAINSGADMVNDIWGLKYDPKMAKTIKNYQVACCLMHNRATAFYENFMTDFFLDLGECIELAKAADISADKIMIDPGVGFGKNYEHNMACIANVAKLHEFGYPVLLATSRKGFIKETLQVPVDERVEGTLATTVYAVMNGCNFVRVHDIKENKRIIDMTEAIINYRL